MARNGRISLGHTIYYRKSSHQYSGWISNVFSIQSVVDNEALVIDDNDDVDADEEEEARSPLLHSIGDPALDFVRKGFKERDIIGSSYDRK